MKDKVFYGFLVLAVIGFFGFAIANKAPEKPRPGTEHQDNGRTHVQSKKYGGDELSPSSYNHHTV